MRHELDQALRWGGVWFVRNKWEYQVVDFPYAEYSNSSLRTFLLFLDPEIPIDVSGRFIIHSILFELWVENSKKLTFTDFVHDEVALSFATIQWLLTPIGFAIFSIQMTFYRICIFANSPQHNFPPILHTVPLKRCWVVEMVPEKRLSIE